MLTTRGPPSCKSFVTFYMLLKTYAVFFLLISATDKGVLQTGKALAGIIAYYVCSVHYGGAPRARKFGFIAMTSSTVRTYVRTYVRPSVRPSVRPPLYVSQT